MSLPCPVQINSLSTRMSDKNATQTKRMLCCKCLKWLKNVHSLAAIKYVLQVPYFYSKVSLWPHTFRSFRKRNLGENVDNRGVQGEDKKKKSSHSTNLFKYIQYKSIHIHYSAADITKSNVTKNPVGKVRERKKNQYTATGIVLPLAAEESVIKGLLLYGLL